MRVVIDTNIFVSSFFGGKPRAVIDLWKEQKITLCLSREILDEYVVVLQRLGLDERLLDELLSLFAKGRGILYTGKTPNIRAVEEDPDDDKFIGCAVALKAGAIITGDNSLLNIGEFRGIKILTPRQFIEMMS